MDASNFKNAIDHENFCMNCFISDFFLCTKSLTKEVNRITSSFVEEWSAPPWVLIYCVAFFLVLNVSTSAQISVIINESRKDEVLKYISPYPALHLLPYFNSCCLVVAAALNGKIIQNISERQIYLQDGKVKYGVNMANKWRDAPIYGRASPVIRHFLVVFDVSVLKLNQTKMLCVKTDRTLVEVWNSGHSILTNMYTAFLHFHFLWTNVCSLCWKCNAISVDIRNKNGEKTEQWVDSYFSCFYGRSWNV